MTQLICKGIKLIYRVVAAAQEVLGCVEGAATVQPALPHKGAGQLASYRRGQLRGGTCTVVGVSC